MWHRRCRTRRRPRSASKRWRPTRALAAQGAGSPREPRHPAKERSRQERDTLPCCSGSAPPRREDCNFFAAGTQEANRAGSLESQRQVSGGWEVTARDDSAALLHQPPCSKTATNVSATVMLLTNEVYGRRGHPEASNRRSTESTLAYTA